MAGSEAPPAGAAPRGLRGWLDGSPHRYIYRQAGFVPHVDLCESRALPGNRQTGPAFNSLRTNSRSLGARSSSGTLVAHPAWGRGRGPRDGVEGWFLRAGGPGGKEGRAGYRDGLNDLQEALSDQRRRPSPPPNLSADSGAVAPHVLPGAPQPVALGQPRALWISKGPFPRRAVARWRELPANHHFLSRGGDPRVSAR
jgi:hypothetical protein